MGVIIGRLCKIGCLPDIIKALMGHKKPYPCGGLEFLHERRNPLLLLHLHVQYDAVDRFRENLDTLTAALRRQDVISVGGYPAQGATDGRVVIHHQYGVRASSLEADSSAGSSNVLNNASNSSIIYCSID